MKMRLGHLLRFSSRCVLRFSENVQVKVWNMCTLKMYTVYPFTPLKSHQCCVTSYIIHVSIKIVKQKIGNKSLKHDSLLTLLVVLLVILYVFLSRMGPTYTHHSKHNAFVSLVSPGQKELELEWLEVFRKG